MRFEILLSSREKADTQLCAQLGAARRLEASQLLQDPALQLCEIDRHTE